MPDNFEQETPRVKNRDVKPVSPPEFFRVTEVLNPGDKAKATRMSAEGKQEGLAYDDTVYMEATIHDPNHQSFRLPGEIIQARWHRGNSRYEVSKNSGLFRHVVADSAIPKGSEGTVSVHSGTTKGLTDSFVDIQACNGWVEQVIEAGDKLYARYVPFTERWWLLPGTEPPNYSDVYICNFTLTTALALGGTATATVGVCSDNVAGIFGSPITVEDTIGKFKGAIGYKGQAWKYKSDTSCNWQIVELEEQAEMITATIDSQFAGGSTTGDSTDFWQGRDPGNNLDLADPLDLYSRVPSGAELMFSYDEILDVYNAVDGLQAPAGDEDCEDTLGRGVWVSNAWATLDGNEVWPVTKIRANRDTLLRGGYDAALDTYLVQIDPAECEDSIIHSDGVSVRWTQGPDIAHHITVSGMQDAEAGESYIRIKGNAKANTLGTWTFGVNAESAGNEQAWMMPENRPTEKNQHIVSVKTGQGSTPSTPECILLKWTAQGKDGTFEFPTSIDIDFAGETWTWDESCLITVEAGVITGIQAKAAPGDTISVGCTDSTTSTTNDLVCDIQTAKEQNPCLDGEEADAPAVAANGGSGNDAWSTPDNAKTNNTTYTTAGPLANTETSQELSLTDWSFNIPTGATINGIKLEVKGYNSGAEQNMDDHTVELLNVTGGSSNKASTDQWLLSDTGYSRVYGGEADLWTATPTPADINSASFGFKIRVQKSNTSANNPTAEIDHARITVYYSP